ncbi:MAG: hypothetical protein KF723_21425 [Rhizobiaceae bacterium]|nr:hypothetical protein [Rhizobiaceae bacterium]
MNQADFEAMLARVPAPFGQPTDSAAPSTLSTSEPTTTPAPEAAPQLDTRPDGTKFSEEPAPEPGLGDATGLDAFTGGVLKSVFETKDFLFGEPAGKSDFRESVETNVETRREQSMMDGFSAGVGQFFGAMIGLGKFTAVAKTVPWFGKGLGAVANYAPKTAEAAKAAIAGAVAFDPHEERLSNLIQETPFANPLNAWLAADPSDSAAEGRLKAALESIGLDATILGTFVAGTKIWKALRKGDADEASRLVDVAETDARARVEAEELAPEPGTAELPAMAEDAPTGLPEAPAGKANEEVVDGTRGQAPGESPDAGAAGSGAEASTADHGLAQSTAHEGQPIGGAGPDRVSLDADPVGGASVSEPAPTIVANATDAADLAGTQLAKPGARIRLSDEDTQAVFDSMDSDAFAVEQAGGWYEALEIGHTFGKGEGIPYARLNAPQDVDDFMARVVDVAEAKLDVLRGGKVLADEKVTKVVGQVASLFNVDPANVLGMIHQASKEAPHMVAMMESGYLVANRMFQDAYALASRIRLGDFVEFGGRDAAMSELKRRLSLAASVYGSARSMTAAAGRAVRRMRVEFAVSPEQVAGLNSMDSEQLVQLLVETGGDQIALRRIVGEPTLWQRTKDLGEFLYVNGLLSGPKTHVINMLSNSYMIAARPAERVLGALPHALAGEVAANRVLRESLRQYTYLGTAFTDAFAQARRAFTLNDSVLAPHRTEAFGVAQGRRGMADMRSFKPWSSPGNVLHNAMVAAVNVIGLPTRTMGFVDELAKQTTYRSTILTKAHSEALEAGRAAGHVGKALRDFVRSAVRKRLDDAFDATGKATDAEALREAQIATFQQELAPRSFGRWVQSGADSFMPLRLLIPFVRTPVQILRYGWRLTPGLNLAQTEYRDMLTGRMGHEARMQATGQMALGGLFMGSAAFLVSNGTITGGGPRDYHAAEALRATGWQPYSVVVQNDDGSKTYAPFGRIDPVAMPFGIIADLMDALNASDGDQDDPAINAAVGGLLVALARAVENRNYLAGIGHALDALSDPEGQLGGLAGQTVANFAPFSAALRQLNPDPHIREARELADKVMATVPGLSETLPAKYDAWGDPVVTRKGLWSSDTDQLVDREMQRLLLESGTAIMRPQPRHGGVDLRDLTMSDGRNAFVVYQQLAGHPPRGPSLKELIARRIGTEAYRLAPDGGMAVKGTKLWLLHPIVDAYRTRALKMLRRDPVVRDALRAADLKARAEAVANRKAAGKTNSPAKKLSDSLGLDLDNLTNGN